MYWYNSCTKYKFSNKRHDLFVEMIQSSFMLRSLQLWEVKWMISQFGRGHWFVVVSHSSSRVWLLATPWTTASQASLSFTISLSCSNSCSLDRWCHPPSHPPSPSVFLPSIFSSFRVFSNESTIRIRCPKYWSFSISRCNEYSGFISFRVDWFDLFAVQGTLKSLPQDHNSKTSIIQCAAFFMTQFSHPYVTTRKTIALTTRTFVRKVTFSAFFNMLPRCFIAFLPRSNHLLISWLLPPFTVIFGAQEKKISHCFHFTPSVCHEVMGKDAMVLFFWIFSFKPVFCTLLFHPH